MDCPFTPDFIQGYFQLSLRDKQCSHWLIEMENKPLQHVNQVIPYLYANQSVMTNDQ
jgi:hypothetical protein